MIMFLIGIALSSIFYRLGGTAKTGQWYEPIIDGKWRDIGCSLVVVVLLGEWFSWHWTLALSFVLMWAALTTYWKKSRDARWVHWLAHGFGVAVALLPTVIHEGFWVGFSIRAVVLPIAMMLTSEAFDNPITDELWRGALIVITLPLILIG